MKILICSHSFWPEVGGAGKIILDLANEFLRQGHSVTLITPVPGEAQLDREKFQFCVVRQVGFLKTFVLAAQHDVVVINDLLKCFIPPFCLGKPWFVRHNIWIRRAVPGKNKGIAGSSWGLIPVLKQITCFLATKNIVVSQAIAEGLWTKNKMLIWNCYDEEVFKLQKHTLRQKKVLFVGRLVAEKGPHILLEALGKLKKEGLTPECTFVGNGKEMGNLVSQAKKLGLEPQTTFWGSKDPEGVAKAMNEHEILVVPSAYDEPFGIVALEGIACGCVVVGSSGGGLPVAVGKCGCLFPNGDADALAGILKKMLLFPQSYKEQRRNAEEHLKLFQKKRIAQEHISLFEKYLKRF